VWGRIAYLTAVADTAEEARRAITAAADALVVVEAPPSADGLVDGSRP
jgi:hypothetical protein